MSAADYLTWDGTEEIQPHRPSVEDLGGDQLENDQSYPPDPAVHPTAEGWNQKVKQLEALARVTPAAIISVTFSEGNPNIQKVTSAKNPSLLPIETFTVLDYGDGDTEITWPVGTFPPHVSEPFGLTQNDDTAIDRLRAYSVGNGVRVQTALGESGTDASFTVAIG